ncbi:MAG: hypothetical protein ACKOEH_10415 [Actinomycetota bacterium]
MNSLLAEWGMLADFCFADMLLYLPTRGATLASAPRSPNGNNPAAIILVKSSNIAK